MTAGPTNHFPVARAAAFATLARGDLLGPAESADVGTAATTDPDPRVRAAAIAAVVRVGVVGVAIDAWAAAIVDPHAQVRRRAAETGPPLVHRLRDGNDPEAASGIGRALVARLDDDDVTVVEAAAWGLGELGALAVESAAVGRLSEVTTGHDDAIARESAVAALGALGDPAGLAAILRATQDKPTVRRRAVLALAPFDGDEVDAALRRARDDRDWQVRQAAEDLMPDEAPDEAPDGAPDAGGSSDAEPPPTRD